MGQLPSRRAGRYVIARRKYSQITANAEVAYQSTVRPAHEAFRQPRSGHTKVWRYIDLPKLIWTLEQKALYFARLDMLVDAFEGAVTQPTYASQQLEHRPEVFSEFRRVDMRRQTFVNCWRVGDSESEAMWRLYCRGKAGVALQTTYSRLDRSLSSVLSLGVVQYVDYEVDIMQAPKNMLSAVMHKRKSFEHEREVRAVAWRRNPLVRAAFPLAPDNHGLLVPWDPMCLEAVFVHPEAEAWYADVVRSVLHRYFAGLENLVCWSRIKDAPLF